jgi:hypothetical protein
MDVLSRGNTVLFGLRQSAGDLEAKLMADCARADQEVLGRIKGFESGQSQKEGEIEECYRRKKLVMAKGFEATRTAEQAGALRKMQNRRLKLVAQLEGVRKELAKQQSVSAGRVRSESETALGARHGNRDRDVRERAWADELAQVRDTQIFAEGRVRALRSSRGHWSRRSAQAQSSRNCARGCGRSVGRRRTS